MTEPGWGDATRFPRVGGNQRLERQLWADPGGVTARVTCQPPH